VHGLPQAALQADAAAELSMQPPKASSRVSEQSGPAALYDSTFDIWPKDMNPIPGEGGGQCDGKATHICRPFLQIVQPCNRSFAKDATCKKGPWVRSAGPLPALLLVPGGFMKRINDGYREFWRKTQAAGIVTLVLHMRQPAAITPQAVDGGYEPQDGWMPLIDLQRALVVARQHAEEWNIDPERIGLAGMSSGGGLATLFSAGHWQERLYEPIDEADQLPMRPAFTVLLYPGALNSTSCWTADDDYLEKADSLEGYTEYDGEQEAQRQNDKVYADMADADRANTDRADADRADADRADAASNAASEVVTAQDFSAAKIAFLHIKLCSLLADDGEPLVKIADDQPPTLFLAGQDEATPSGIQKVFEAMRDKARNFGQDHIYFNVYEHAGHGFVQSVELAKAKCGQRKGDDACNWFNDMLLFFQRIDPEGFQHCLFDDVDATPHADGFLYGTNMGTGLATSAAPMKLANSTLDAPAHIQWPELGSGDD